MRGEWRDLPDSLTLVRRGYIGSAMTNLLLDRRFVDDALGFALTWNYWFNDAVSTASDIIALQLLLEFWTENFPGWAISLIFLVVVIALNILSVRVYGEVRSALLNGLRIIY
jgi:amino acid permease